MAQLAITSHHPMLNPHPNPNPHLVAVGQHEVVIPSGLDGGQCTAAHDEWCVPGKVRVRVRVEGEGEGER